jgi:hypothetical protein
LGDGIVLAREARAGHEPGIVRVRGDVAAARRTQAPSELVDEEELQSFDVE